ncbi:DUF4011 domain-containing protein [Georgenia sp. SUBG003]|uniref:DUF4011 domain-containing protein n=1 Tax=Georgenia sp. SUBG003 TaxID=1497974 RepID=UPI003AB1D022
MYSGVRGNTVWSFRGSPEEGDEDTEVPTQVSGRVLEVARPHKELGPVLRNLMRKADTEYLDRGLHVLYLAVGMLHWAELDGTPMQSPVLLLPVTLESDGPDPFRTSAAPTKTPSSTRPSCCGCRSSGSPSRRSTTSRTSRWTGCSARSPGR